MSKPDIILQAEAQRELAKGKQPVAFQGQISGVGAFDVDGRPVPLDPAKRTRYQVAETMVITVVLNMAQGNLADLVGSELAVAPRAAVQRYVAQEMAGKDGVDAAAAGAPALPAGAGE